MQHKFTPTTHLKRAALTLLALILTCATAWAQFAGGDGSPTNPYLINDETQWNYFCDMLANNDKGIFDGKTVKLGANISVSRMAGGDNHDFTGTFDGNHKTLAFTATAETNYLAPFRNVLGNSTTDHAVIRDLNVVTNITANDCRHMAGLIAVVWGYVDVTNCNVTANISSTKGTNNPTDLYPAGIASQVASNSLLTVSGCTVDGTISTDGKYASGIIGIAQGSATITNSISSVIINSSTEGDGTHGGIVAIHNSASGTLTITGCVFNGSLLGPTTNACGGIVGYYSKGTVNIYNTLFAPTEVTMDETNSATFIRRATASCHEGCYYTQEFNDGTNNLTGQGQIAYTRTNLPDNIGAAGTNYGIVQAYANGLKFNNTYYVGSDSDLTVNNAGTEYTINTATGWNYFCAVLAENAQGYFTGKTVKLGNSITVGTMAGDSDHKFSGTFDGNSKTLTFNYTATATHTAPFRYVQGTSEAHAVIHDLNVVTTITATGYRHQAGLVSFQSGYLDVTDCNVTVNINTTVGTNNDTDLYPAGLVSQVAGSAQLTVSGCTVGGTITSNGQYASGMIAVVQGSASISGCTVGCTINTSAKYAAGYISTMQGSGSASITNCVSSVTINSSVNGDGTHGGFVGAQGNTLTIEGCLFNGSLLGTTTNSCGGFVGWKNGTVNISNSLFAPASVNIGTSDSYTFSRRSGTNITNCYYTQAFGTAQGTQAYSISKGENVTTLANAGTVSNDYTTSGLTFYNVGLKCGNVLYAAENNQVSLTLAHQEVPEGYIFNGYTATPESATLSGEANPYSLTMPDANVTIGATFSFLSIAYIDENGQQQFCTEYTVLSEDFHSYLYAGQWYVVKDDIEYDDNFETWGNGAANIILVDGKTCSIFAGYGFRAIKGNVNIYGQSLGTGTLNLTGGNELIDPEENSYSQSAIFGNIAVYGGIVTANSGEYQEVGPDPAILGNVVCRRGKLTANIGDFAIMGSTVDFSGGKLTANGIIHSDVTINWTNSSDRFYANSLSNSVTISNGKAFCYTDNTGLHILGPGPDNGDYILSAEEKAAIAGKTLYPAVAITLSEGITAVSGIIANGDGNYAKVGETVTVSATAPLGYTPTVTYTPEGGEATVANDLGNGTYSFTVPAANVSVDTDALHSTGQPVSVTYMNADGTTGTHEAIALDETMTTLAGGWYFVGKDIAYNSTITLNGDVTIILADGKTMSVGTSDTPISGDAIKGEIGNWPNHYYYALTVYGQSLADSTAGTLSLHTSSVGIYVKAYTQHSGKVSITSVYNSGIWTLGDAVTINGGHLDVNVGNVAIFAYSDVIINGGTVNATGQGEGISSSNNGNITLGWTNTSDYIYANSYETTGTIAIASGQAFIDEDGTVHTSDDLGDINGKTLHPIDGCLPPSHLTATDITTTTATLTWTSDAEDFDMEYAINPASTFDFDDGTLQGWTNLIVNQGGGHWVHSENHPCEYDYSSYAHSGSGFALSYSYINCDEEAYNTDVYLVSPQPYQITEGASLTFFYKQANESWQEYFEVCVATAANPTAINFTDIWNSSSESSSGWTEVNISLDDYAGQTIWIAFHDEDENVWEVWIDDVTINPGAVWTPVNESISTNQYTLTGLAPETTYLVRVRANCDADDISLWSNIATFTTLDPCEIVPSELTATNITATSATLNWSGVQDSYNVRYRTAGGEEFNFFEGFEGCDWTLPNGWTTTEGGWFACNNCNEIEAHSGGYFAGGYSSGTWLITPMMDLSGQNNVTLNFWYINVDHWGSDPAQLKVYYRIVEDDEPTDWEWLWSSEGSHTQWTEATISLTVDLSANYQIGFYLSQGNPVFLDDISITSTGTRANEWQTIDNIADTTTTVTGLTPETPYEWQVQGRDCDGNGGATDWSEMGTFTTPDPCEAPSGLTVTDITTSTATLNWSGVQDSYVVIYRTADVEADTLLNEDFERYEYPDFPEGWTNNGWFVNDYYHHSGANSVEIDWSNADLITPVLEISENANVVINFWYITEESDEVTPQLEVYYRHAEFPEDRYPLWSSVGSHPDWTEASIAVEDWGNIQLVFTVSGSDDYFYVYLDDITVTSYTGYGEWQTIDSLAATTTTLTGLTPEKPYQWQVRGISEYCPYSHPEWSERGSFTTPLLPAVSYIDENGEQLQCTAYTPLDGTETSLGTADQETWYVADGTLNYSQTLTLNGDVHLILKDGAVMNVGTEQQPISGEYGIGEYGSLHIYGQSAGSGHLCIYCEEYGISVDDDYEQNGGNVTISTGIHGIFTGGDVTLRDGTLNTIGDSYYGISGGGNVNILGGKCTAKSKQRLTGINANSDGSIILGWKNTDDYIDASGYALSNSNAVVQIADGQLFIDEDGNTYSGIIERDETTYTYPIDGKKLYPDCVVFKQVEGYEDGEGGYCLIASPNVDNTDPATINGMTLAGDEAVNYDLYRFDPTNEGSEWVNYKADSFNLVNGHGYLYALKNTKTLVFTGPFITDTDSLAVELEYDATDDHKCWNLVGNPFPCEATINKPYYVLNADGMTINPTAIEGNIPIPPCTAVFVKGESGDDTVVFSKVSAPASSAPIGAIDGLFSVSADKQVYFSQGNLQYQPSTATWRFAPNQYDLLFTPEDLNLYHSAVGNYADVTSLYTENYTDWIDFFGWGTSGWNSGANAYMPYSTSYMADDFYPGGDYNNDLTGTCANADWAWYNPISNGGNAANQWRTLTHDEWAYLFSGRDGATSKYGHGSVDGVNGMIILPDNWTLPDGCSFTPGNSNWTNSYTTTEWAAMEAAGAVFLPAAGQRSFGTFVNNVGNLGRYWSSTHRNSTAAYDVWFYSDFISELDTQVYYSNRSMGYSVRPVQDAQ